VVLGVEEELYGVTDTSTDVARAVYQLTTWADLDRMSRGGTSTSGDRTRGGIGRFRRSSILSTIGRKSEGLGHCYSNIG